MYSSETDDTTEIGSKLLWFYIIHRNNRESGLITISDGIYFMTLQCRMKIEFSLMIYITDGDTIGITVISEYTENTRGGLMKYTNTFFF
jgi:hypothetical protein